MVLGFSCLMIRVPLGIGSQGLGGWAFLLGVSRALGWGLMVAAGSGTGILTCFQRKGYGWED